MKNKKPQQGRVGRALPSSKSNSSSKALQLNDFLKHSASRESIQLPIQPQLRRSAFICQVTATLAAVFYWLISYLPANPAQLPIFVLFNEQINWGLTLIQHFKTQLISYCVILTVASFVLMGLTFGFRKGRREWHFALFFFCMTTLPNFGVISFLIVLLLLNLTLWLAILILVGSLIWIAAMFFTVLFNRFRA